MRKLFVILTLSLFGAACGVGNDGYQTVDVSHSDGEPSAVETPTKSSAIDTLAIRPAFTKIKGTGKTFQLTVDIWLSDESVVEDVQKDFTDTDSETHTVTWETKNFGVATVDENGLVTTISAGDTYITATVDGHEAKARVIIEAELTTDPNIDVSDIP